MLIDAGSARSSVLVLCGAPSLQRPWQRAVKLHTHVPSKLRCVAHLPLTLWQRVVKHPAHVSLSMPIPKRNGGCEDEGPSTAAAPSRALRSSGGVIVVDEALLLAWQE
jgi:hypothetical protein